MNKPFIIKFDTRKTDRNNFKIKTGSDKYDYNYNVKWEEINGNSTGCEE